MENLQVKPENEIRSQVQKAYGEAITQTACCGGASPGSYAQAIGYSPAETTSAGAEVAGASMGCGNPLSFSEVQAGETVLDLGSGAGFDLLIAAEKVGPEGQVIGVDMTPEMLATAQANVAASGYQNIDLRQGIIENLPVDDASVDWVISNCVINLSPEKERVFGEISRVLKPGGRFSISDIVVADFPDTLRDNPILYNSCIAGAISEEEYLAGLETAGLAKVKVNMRAEFTAELLFSDSPSDFFNTTSPDCCGASTADTQQNLELFIKELQGKVQSLNFVGQKPQQGG
ncbi:MAG: arsenite methyltransferase [Fidelibacterota bacterium]|nr:MAG: arsenite methyltransferase [Candidatus Neomarinimicrobiota bacterium]